MKRFRINVLAAVAVAAAAGTMSFKAPVLQQWVFTGSDESEILDASFYSLSAPEGDCRTKAALPCKLNVSATNQSQLQAYLNPRTEQQIMAEAVGQRD